MILYFLKLIYFCNHYRHLLQKRNHPAQNHQRIDNIPKHRSANHSKTPRARKQAQRYTHKADNPTERSVRSSHPECNHSEGAHVEATSQGNGACTYGTCKCSSFNQRPGYYQCWCGHQRFSHK